MEAFLVAAPYQITVNSNGKMLSELESGMMSVSIVAMIIWKIRVGLNVEGVRDPGLPPVAINIRVFL